MASDSNVKPSKIETIIRLNARNDINQTLSQSHPVILHLNRADKRRNTQFINSAKKLEALFVYQKDSSQVSG
jgi:hypothetical protein